MTYLRRSPILLLPLIMLLPACGGPASSATTAALVKGEFVGDAGHLAFIGLSTNGKRVIAYLCNGTYKHVSRAEWFKGPVTGKRISITDARGTHLVATVSKQAITGTVTFKGGRSQRFTAPVLSSPGNGYGVFRSQRTIRGVRYLGGWIFKKWPKKPASASGPAGARAFLASAVTPLMIGPEPEWGRGGIINERTGKLIVSPPLDKANPFRVTVPHLGTFRLTQCHQARC